MLIQRKIANTLDNQGYTAPSQLRADLWLLARSLDDIGATRITRSEVLPVIRLVDIFGFHGAVLDIRQNSAFHDPHSPSSWTERAFPRPNRSLNGISSKDCRFWNWSFFLVDLSWLREVQLDRRRMRYWTVFAWLRNIETNSGYAASAR